MPAPRTNSVAETMSKTMSDAVENAEALCPRYGSHFACGILRLRTSHEVNKITSDEQLTGVLG